MASPGPEIIIKMSLLSISNDANGRSKGFSLKDIEVLCFTKNKSREGYPYYVFIVSTVSWKTISNGLNFVTQT